MLDAAAERFVSQGYAATTLRQIAGAAGIKAGSIYHHFDSKESMFIAVLNDGIEVMIKAFAEADAGPARSNNDRVFGQVRAHLGAVFGHGSYTAAHITAFHTAPPTVREQVIPCRDQYEQMWTDLFRDMFPDADRRDLRLHRLILFGAMNTTIEWYDPAGATSLDQLASAITDQFLTGVTP